MELCTRCKKRVAVVFITRIEGDKTFNEGICMKCAKACPKEAITVENNLAYIDQSKCVGCQICVTSSSYFSASAGGPSSITSTSVIPGYCAG